MNIPEELLTMSEKELDKVLLDDIFKAKYLHKKDAKVIRTLYKKEKKVGKKIVLQSFSSEDYILNDNRELSLFFKSLTKNTLRQIKENNIYDRFASLNDTSFLNFCYKKAVEVYGEEFVDIDEDYYSILIYFPEILIKNSAEQEHLIKDLYVQLVFNEDCNKLREIQIARTTATEKELRNNYLFSHLNCKNLGEFSYSVCLGSGTVIRNLYTKIRTDSFNFVKNYVNFLHTLKYYLSWESVEGVPYYYINNVINDSNRYKEVYDISYDLDYFLPLIKNLSDFKYRYSITDTNICIKLEQESIDVIDNILTENCPKEYKYLRHDKRSVKRESNNNSFYKRYNGESAEFKFKEQEISLKVIPDEEDDAIEILPLKIHIEILTKVVNYIEKEFTKYLINKKLNETI